jgi:hypothetical protein
MERLSNAFVYKQFTKGGNLRQPSLPRRYAVAGLIQHQRKEIVVS